MSVKKLAGQTIWYGVPRIVSRFLYFGISLLGFQLYDPNGTYAYTQVYAVIPFLNILSTYGLETSYFRFAQSADRKELYSTLNISLFASTILFTLVLFLFKDALVSFVELEKHPEYISWMIWILFFDTLATLPMAKLRLEERPRKYAFINVASILVNILIVLFFFYVAKPAYETDPDSFVGQMFDPAIGIGYFFIANLVASAFTLLLLNKEFRDFKFKFNRELWKSVINYSYPLIIVGLGGMINEMLSRLVYRKILNDDPIIEERELGIFGANYKLAVLISIFIQIFRMAAEPFFFNQSKNEGAQKTYARVMKFFVIACCFMFLVISLFLDFWKLLIASKFEEYAEGIHIVPILAMGSVFLGIYYNLSIWYKLTDRNMTGAYITIAGAVLTIVLNIVLVPDFRYTGAAWATFFCYLFMMVASYYLGQKYYPVPYAKKKLLTYIIIVAFMYILHEIIIRPLDENFAYYTPLYYGSSLVLLIAFTMLIMKTERKEFARLPLVGRFFR